ncbi:MAG TPA: S8 family serine peptidase [Chryseolinea sp.]|nr:S8 family serine peptidase [Chryseolinea sp.]
MPEISIHAYYFGREEEALILKHVKMQEQTASFIFGLAGPSDVSALRKAGILLDILQPASMNPEGLGRGMFSESGRGVVHYQSDVSGIGPVPVGNLFLIQIRGSLLPSWKRRLEEEGIVIRESLRDDVYKVQTDLNVASLQSIDFVLAARHFESTDTEVVVRRSVIADLGVFDLLVSKIAIYDIRVDEDRTDSVVDFFKSKGVSVEDWRPGKVRVILQGMGLITELRKLAQVHLIEEFVRPTIYNDKARRILNTESVDGDTVKLSIPYMGEGQIVGVADTGIDVQHPDLKDQIHKVVALGRPDDPSDPNGHGTHVAGSIAGNGAASGGLIKGLAPKAKLFFQSVMDAEGSLGGLPLDLRDLFQQAYDEGVRIHNNSWGAMAESEYLFNSLEVDEFVYRRKDMLIIIAAGNEGTAFQPRNSQAGFVDWLSLGSPATAKNALTVGASRSNRQSGGFASISYGDAWPDAYPEDPLWGQKVSGDPECLAGFSSRGPCGNESRIKPDVVAPGTDIASTKSSRAPVSNFWGPYPKNRAYAFMGGTSMATPIVAGFAALIREYFVKVFACRPSAALLKAAIINSTKMLQGSDALADYAFIPNFHQGFGCVDMMNAIPNNLQKNLKLAFIDSWETPELQFSSTGERFLFSINVSTGASLRVCLCWTDPPGRGLQNNLNVFVMHRQEQRKWVGNHELPRTITSFDRDNNVEIIRVDKPLPGEYMIAIQAANIIFSPQDFAMVVTGDLTSTLTQL